MLAIFAFVEVLVNSLLTKMLLSYVIPTVKNFIITGVITDDDGNYNMNWALTKFNSSKINTTENNNMPCDYGSRVSKSVWGYILVFPRDKPLFELAVCKRLRSEGSITSQFQGGDPKHVSLISSRFILPRGIRIFLKNPTYQPTLRRVNWGQQIKTLKLFLKKQRVLEFNCLNLKLLPFNGSVNL